MVTLKNFDRDGERWKSIVFTVLYYTVTVSNVTHRPHGDKSNNFLGMKGVYVVIVNVMSMILHKVNIPFEILIFALYIHGGKCS